jgi:hypothetical protein
LLGKYENILTKESDVDSVKIKLHFERGTASIMIDRKKPDKRKFVEVQSSGGMFRLEQGVLTLNDSNVMTGSQDLLPLEINSFLESEHAFDWQEIDATIARILTDLKN